jgi:predicted  nucleic acid-binding Zn-ribbon protein
MSTHICSPCGGEFATEQEYLDHVCPKSGVTPKDPENLGEEFKAISEAALKRGEERKIASAKPKKK